MFYQKKSGLGENILDGGQTINAALASDKKKKLPKTKKPGISTILSFPPECYRLRCVILLSESEDISLDISLCVGNGYSQIHDLSLLALWTRVGAAHGSQAPDVRRLPVAILG